MKKQIIILFLFAFSLFTYKGKIENTFIEKIDLKLKEEEVGIVFLPVKNSNFLLVKTKENSIVIPIYGKENPKEVLERFGEENPTYSYIDSIKGKKESIGNEQTIDNIKVTKENSNFILSKGDKNFCIYYEGSIKSCDYVYFVKEIKIEDSVKLAFYNENLSSSFEKKLNNHWIDIYKIKKNEFTLLTLHEDTYNVVKLPNYYFHLS